MRSEHVSLLLGCIADDFTGATDLANTLAKAGMPTVQWIGVPGPDDEVPGCEALVIALKSRTAPVKQAIDQSVCALRWLREAGARQLFFKYCSTFDSTPEGNIGPVAEALLDELREQLTIACPAFPANGRTVYRGYLFVGDVLLSESGMQTHPLTPMTEPSLVRHLGRQVKSSVGLVPYETVERGPEAIRAAIRQLTGAGHRFAVVDALTDRHLLSIGEACADVRLVTGGSGVAMGLPENFRRQGLSMGIHDPTLPPAEGHAVVLSGSCSPMTLAQVEQMRGVRPAFRIDPLKLAADDDTVAEVLAWAEPELPNGPVLLYASAPPDEVAQVQQEIGRERAGELVERAMSDIAVGLVERGVRQLIVAGGETGGAVVQGLGIRALRIGPEIDPGVPWTMSLGEPRLHVALKSGNFGSADFFLKAFRMLG
jgi:uncharacterized protein YgbK (DUF1537 family)